MGQGPIPYHGYYYRVLTQQGPNAPGGTLDYVVKGKMIGGFALLAWPAEYGNSGVMTFLVNHNGVVYQKDLGDYTDEARQADELRSIPTRPGRRSTPRSPELRDGFSQFKRDGSRRGPGCGAPGNRTC